MTDGGRRRGPDRTVFTDEVLAAIPYWVRLGASADDIAAALGTTVGSLQYACWKHRISLSYAAYAQGERPQPVLMASLRSALPGDVVDGLVTAAQSRGTSAPALVARVLAHVVRDELFEAVLDETAAEDGT